MRVPGTSLLLDLIHKARALISWGPFSAQSGFMASKSFYICKLCGESHKSDGDRPYVYCCYTSGQNLCCKCRGGLEHLVALVDLDGAKRMDSDGVVHIKRCHICTENREASDLRKKNSEKIHPRDSPEPPSPCFSGLENIGSSVDSESIQTAGLAGFMESQDNINVDKITILDGVTSISARLSPVSICRNPSRYRSIEGEALDSGKHLCSLLSECCNETSDIGSHSFSSKYDCYVCKSVGSTPSDSPSTINFSSNRGVHYVQQEQDTGPSSPDCPLDQENMTVLKPDMEIGDAGNSEYCSDDLSVFRRQYENSRMPLDFENNGLMWFPPPPNDEDDEVHNSYFDYDDDDDDMGYSGSVFSSSCSLSSNLSGKERQHDGDKEPLRAMVQAHFRALVSQLFHGEGIMVGKEGRADVWIGIVAAIAWQASNFVKPDTSRGGSMDPCDYVKVKCVASGSPMESTYIKGVVCTKNVKHKRMNSQYKNPRILILGGALEYQRSTNELASFDTLLQQEIDHLKMITSKIEALHTNVLLVEKSVSPYAQEYLLAKDISLVLNVKRPLLERISRCTGAGITPSTENISIARLGHCELFRLERVPEEHEVTHNSSKKLSKTLMYFEGCPRRLGCTIILRGACRDELKKIKQVVQYAVFAAYHLSLETSFLADEGATLPKISFIPSLALHERTATNSLISKVSPFGSISNFEVVPDSSMKDQATDEYTDVVGVEIVSGQAAGSFTPPSIVTCVQSAVIKVHSSDSTTAEGLEYCVSKQFREPSYGVNLHCDGSNIPNPENLSAVSQNCWQPDVATLVEKSKLIEDNEVVSEYFSAADSNQSILVSFSSRCVLKGTICERSRLLRIKFYGSFDKPLGKYLCDDLFDQKYCCQSCEEPMESHVMCYTHQQGNLTVNVKRISSMKLPGEQDGKIWMWHRCLKCALVNGVPPATRRVVMSDAAWGLSFGKFLELSFSNYATANRLATCGHSLQRDCLRYYGFGSMVAFFRYSPIEILSVSLPPSVLPFHGLHQEWLRKEAAELRDGMQDLYHEIWDALDSMEQKCMFFGHELIDLSELCSYIRELKDQFKMERDDYNKMLAPTLMESMESLQPAQSAIDILNLNSIRQSLLIGSCDWDRRLYSINLLLERNSPKADKGESLHTQLKQLRREACYKDPNNMANSELVDTSFLNVQTDQELDTNLSSSGIGRSDCSGSAFHQSRQEESLTDGEISYPKVYKEAIPCDELNLSERIDSAWTGSDLIPSQSSGIVSDSPAVSVSLLRENDKPFKRIMSPVRVHSFDSAMRIRERAERRLTSSLHFSTLGSFHASGDYRSMVRDPISNVLRAYSLLSPGEAPRLNCTVGSAASFISTAPLLSGGARLLLQQTGQKDIVIAVYDDEPTSIISYALSSKEYEDWVSDNCTELGGGCTCNDSNKEDCIGSTYADLQFFGSLELHVAYGSYGSEEAPLSLACIY